MICAANPDGQFIFHKVISLDGMANVKIVTLMNKNIVYVINPGLDTRGASLIKKNAAALDER